MESIQAPSFQDYTDKLMGQFHRASETLESLMIAGFTREEGVTMITAIVASTFVPQESTPGQSAQFYSDWHSSIAERCSEEYRQIREDLPELRKTDANQDPYLLRLNSIRRGVRMAMVNEYAAAEKLSASES